MTEKDINDIRKLSDTQQIIASNEKKDRDNDLKDLDVQEQKEIIATRNCTEILIKRLKPFVYGRKKLPDIRELLFECIENINTAERILVL